MDPNKIAKIIETYGLEALHGDFIDALADYFEAETGCWCGGPPHIAVCGGGFDRAKFLGVAKGEK